MNKKIIIISLVISFFCNFAVANRDEFYINSSNSFSWNYMPFGFFFPFGYGGFWGGFNSGGFGDHFGDDFGLDRARRANLPWGNVDPGIIGAVPCNRRDNGYGENDGFLWEEDYGRNDRCER